LDSLHLLEKLAPFSFTIISKHTMSVLQAEEGTGRILIARVMHGGAADRSGLIAVGDEVIEVSLYGTF
jgi:C-terminal processing protease CtpA/Prc